MEEIIFRLIAFSASTLSFILGLVVIIYYWRDTTVRLAGLYAIKPFVIHFVGIGWVMPWFYANNSLMLWRSYSTVVGVESYLVLEIVLSAVIIYFFRGLMFSRMLLPQLLLLLDSSQWMVFVSINFFLLKESPFAILPYRLIFCTGYPIFALILGVARKKAKTTDKLNLLAHS